MAIHPQAGQPADAEQLVNVARLISLYYSTKPDMDDPSQQVAFGTSGHRGSSFTGAFTDTHIAAICQALSEYRLQHDITGPMHIGMDTHALSEAAFSTAVEVLCANGVNLVVQQGMGYTPTPVISHAILQHNLGRTSGLADGVVITPSHNPPEDGGFKYNPPHGGPADSDATGWIQDRANQIIRDGMRAINRMSFAAAMKSSAVTERDFAIDYIAQLDQVIDMQAIANAGLSLGTDPLGGAGLAYWDRISEHYKVNIKVVNNQVDHQFGFMRRDKDGKIRMDFSSPFAMSGLIDLRQDFDLAFGGQPSANPSGQPSSNPSGEPSSMPTSHPSGKPSSYPTGQPSSAPSSVPSGAPTGQPTSRPSSEPSVSPTGEPSSMPTSHPSGRPSRKRAGQAKSAPSSGPSGEPTGQPTSGPSREPSVAPT